MVLKQAITIQKVVRRIVCLGDMIVIALVKGSTHSFILLNWQFPVVVGQAESLNCKLHRSSKTHDPRMKSIKLWFDPYSISI